MSRVRTEDAAADAPAVEAKEGGVTHIKYVGGASKRVITAGDWASLGAEGKGDSVWGFHNEFVIAIDEFDEAQLAYLRKDGRFEGVQVEG